MGCLKLIIAGAMLLTPVLGQAQEYMPRVPSILMGRGDVNTVSTVNGPVTVRCGDNGRLTGPFCDVSGTTWRMVYVDGRGQLTPAASTYAVNSDDAINTVERLERQGACSPGLAKACVIQNTEILVEQVRPDGSLSRESIYVTASTDDAMNTLNRLQRLGICSGPQYPQPGFRAVAQSQPQPQPQPEQQSEHPSQSRIQPAR